MSIAFRCQSHSKLKCCHIRATERNCFYYSAAHSCRWPGWTSEQNSAVKYLNSFMWSIRTQFKPSKYLCYDDFIHLIILSGSCRSRSVPVQVLHLRPQKTCNGKSTCSHWSVFWLFLMKHICVSSVVKQLPTKHLFSRASENLRWLPVNKMDVFHHCFHNFFF